ncbi:MAG TPA: metal-dependent hydrolase [Nitrosomonas halophila]|nr:metal-dependent hydrolase [Nitrosomonas halophila]
MDLLTQGLLGASLAQTRAHAHEARLATGVGFFAGLIADADILIQSTNDPLLNIEFHRHFSHSLFFIPLGAFIAAILLWPFVRKHMAFFRLYLFALLGYSLSGVLDALTSYGTHLLWPLSETRLAFNIISVIDPVFTLVLLIATVYAFKHRAAKFAGFGLAIASLYLLLGWTQLQRAETEALALAQARGHDVERLLVKPTLANLLLWRSVYESNDRFYVDAIRVGLLSEPKVYPGESIEKFDPAQYSRQLPETSVLAGDIARFTTFSDGFVALQQDSHDLLVDIRYSSLPTSTAPLWAIAMDPARPQQHAQFQVFRDIPKAVREQFLAMLWGHKLN